MKHSMCVIIVGRTETHFTIAKV